MFLNDICGVYLGYDSLDITIRNALYMELLNCTPKTAPVHHYMIGSSNPKICSV